MRRGGEERKAATLAALVPCAAAMQRHAAAYRTHCYWPGLSLRPSRTKPAKACASSGRLNR